MLDNRQFSLVVVAVAVLSLPIVGAVVVSRWRIEALRPTPAKMSDLALDALKAVDAGNFRSARELVEKIDLAYLDGKGRQTIRLTGQ